MLSFSEALVIAAYPRRAPLPPASARELAELALESYEGLPQGAVRHVECCNASSLGSRQPERRPIFAVQRGLKGNECDGGWRRFGSMTADLKLEHWEWPGAPADPLAAFTDARSWPRHESALGWC